MLTIIAIPSLLAYWDEICDSIQKKIGKIKTGIKRYMNRQKRLREMKNYKTELRHWRGMLLFLGICTAVLVILGWMLYEALHTWMIWISCGGIALACTLGFLYIAIPILRLFIKDKYRLLKNRLKLTYKFN